MPNMSYCRFENTNNAMMDCLDVLEEEGFDGIESKREREYAADLVETAKRLIAAYEAAQSAETEREMGLLPE